MKHTAILIALVAMAACNQPVFDSPEPVGPRKAVWPDIPVPKGMDYFKGEGKATPKGDLRVYRMEMRGGLSVEDLATFYRKTLPVHNWNLQSEQGEAPQPVTLIFTKKIEKLTIAIRSKSMRESHCEININVIDQK